MDRLSCGVCGEHDFGTYGLRLKGCDRDKPNFPQMGVLPQMTVGPRPAHLVVPAPEESEGSSELSVLGNMVQSMDAPGNDALRAQARQYAHTTARLRFTEELLSGRPVYRAPFAWLAHRAARRRMVAVGEVFTGEHWDALVAWVVSGAVEDFFEKARVEGNPFGRIALAHLDELSSLFTGDKPSLLCELIGYVDVAEVAELAERLTPDQVRKVIVAEVERRATVAADPVILHKYVVDGRGRPDLIVQHPASGLRAHFGYANNPGFVFSKPYSIGSIDPDAPDEPEVPDGSQGWSAYTGLGIGGRLYRYGAEMLPEYRWRSTAGPDAARALRRRLHLEAPLRWHSAECSCDPLWAELTALTVSSTPHQLTAGPPIGG